MPSKDFMARFIEEQRRSMIAVPIPKLGHDKSFLATYFGKEYLATQGIDYNPAQQRFKRREDNGKDA